MKSTASEFGTRAVSAVTRRLHSRHTNALGESGGGISLWLYGTKNKSFRVVSVSADRSASKRSSDG